MSNTIKCPHCGGVIDITSALQDDIIKEFNAQMAKQRAEFDKELKEKRREYTKHLEELRLKEEKQDEILQNELKKALIKEREILVQNLKKDLENENLQKFQSMQEELAQKSQKLIEFNNLSAEYEAIKRKNTELEAEYKLKTEQEISKRLQDERENISKKIHGDVDMKMRELEKKNVDLIKTIDELKRKTELGSQQLQGEVMELAIENFLREKYKFDEIKEIKKGENGADCIQVVRNERGLECGIIVYESKRTKEFNAEWIEKLKSDTLKVGGNISVLVTKAMPKDSEKKFIQRAGLIGGVWVCGFDEFKTLSAVLRKNIIDIYEVKVANLNRNSKMDLLYNYLTSDDFKMRVNSVISTFSNLQELLGKEKKAMAKIWADREKQIEIAMNNAIAMQGSIQAIAGENNPVIELENIANLIEYDE